MDFDFKKVGEYDIKNIFDSLLTLKDEWDTLSDKVKSYIECGMVVDHWDDNPLNNHIDNLRWCTSLENSNHRKKKKYAIMETEKKTPLEELIK